MPVVMPEASHAGRARTPAGTHERLAGGRLIHGLLARTRIRLAQLLPGTVYFDTTLLFLELGDCALRHRIPIARFVGVVHGCELDDPDFREVVHPISVQRLKTPKDHRVDGHQVGTSGNSDRSHVEPHVIAVSPTLLVACEVLV